MQTSEITGDAGDSSLWAKVSYGSESIEKLCPKHTIPRIPRKRGRGADAGARRVLCAAGCVGGVTDRSILPCNQKHESIGCMK